MVRLDLLARQVRKWGLTEFWKDLERGRIGEDILSVSTGEESLDVLDIFIY